ncbi:MAG TPA: CPBP family intramembrane glutamic endopeptidase, partial [Flavobacterium sp.]|nr:CPBP family intramembrane glutamic endopeptidase [Flavobacterium sp.]
VAGLLVVVAIPFIEEVIFRLPLKFGRITLNFIVPIMLLGAAGMTGSAQMPALAISLILIIFFFIFNRRALNWLETIWQFRFGWVFYGFTFLFAFIHITNYQVTWLTVALFPLLLAPQFFAGFFIGYTRLRSGFFWGAAFHMLHNGLFVIPALIAMANAFPPVNIQNNEYSLSISKSESDSPAAEFRLNHPDSLVMKNYAFKGILAILLDKEEKMIEVDDTFAADTKLDISYGRIMAENETVPDAQNEAMTKEYKNDILSEMKKAYGFVLENEKQDTQYYELYIKDSLKAKKHVVKSAHIQPSQVFIGIAETKLTNVNVEQLTEILGEQYGSVYFDSDIDETFLFTLKFEKMPIEDLEVYFDEHFGLGFKKSKK